MESHRRSGRREQVPHVGTLSPALRRAPRRRFLATLLAGLFAACSGGLFPDAPGGEAALRVYASVAGTTVASITVEVTGPGITTPILANMTIVDGVASATLTLPTGSSRRVVIRAHDAQAVETHRGEQVLTIRPESNPTVSILLEPLVGSVPIEARLGSTVLVVTPDAATIAVGATRQFAASVVGAGGTQTPVTVQWATSQPQKAGVNSSGLVTAIDTGSVRIVGTRNGVAASALVTITSAPAATTARAASMRAHR